jgi:signal recognition particle receptor subunit beta
MAREINCKLVYYGPGLCGKTTNLHYIFAKTDEKAKGKMLTLETDTERTLFFDFIPIEVGKIGDFKVRLHLYSVPGQVFYDASRKLVLEGADGVVFVADSQTERMSANAESLDNLQTNLAEMGSRVGELPLVVQYNKRDLPNALPVEELRSTLNPFNVPDFEADARTGAGVFDTLKCAAKLVLKQVRQQ